MAKVYGRHAKVVWTPGTGGEDLRRSSGVLLDCIAVRCRWPLKLTDITPLGDAEEEVASMGTAGRTVLLRFDARDGSPSILPSHVPGTLRLYENKHSGAYREGSAIVERLDWGGEADKGGDVQHQWYAMRFTGAVTTGTDTAPTLLTATWAPSPGVGGLRLTFSRDIARSSAALLNGIIFIDSAGDKNTVVVEPTISGATAIVLPDINNITNQAGSFTPINSIDIVASFFKADDDGALEVAAISDFTLT